MHQSKFIWLLPIASCYSLAFHIEDKAYRGVCEESMFEISEPSYF